MNRAEIRDLLECGRYRELLRDLTGRTFESTSRADITDVLTDLMEEHPELQALLVSARVFLVQRPDAYARAERARDRVFILGKRRYGPFFFDMFPHHDVWEHVSERAPETDESPESFAASQWRHFEERISELPVLELVRPPVSHTVEATTSTPGGMTRDIEFILPEGFRPGWVLRSSVPLEGQTQYARSVREKPRIWRHLGEVFLGLPGAYALQMALRLAADQFGAERILENDLTMLLLLVCLVRVWAGRVLSPGEGGVSLGGRVAGSTAYVALVAVAVARLAAPETELLLWLVSAAAAMVIAMVWALLSYPIRRVFEPLTLVAFFAVLPPGGYLVGVILQAALGLTILWGVSLLVSALPDRPGLGVIASFLLLRLWYEAFLRQLRGDIEAGAAAGFMVAGLGQAAFMGLVVLPGLHFVSEGIVLGFSWQVVSVLGNLPLVLTVVVVARLVSLPLLLFVQETTDFKPFAVLQMCMGTLDIPVLVAIVTYLVHPPLWPAALGISYAVAALIWLVIVV